MWNENIKLRWFITKSNIRTLQFKIISEGSDGYTEYSKWTDVPTETEI